MPELMIKYDDLRLYWEKRHVGSVPIEHIKAMPTIEVEPVRHGRWIPIDGEPYAKCSYCGEKHYGCATPYCDMCGSRMDADHIADASKKVGGVDNG